MANRPLKTCSVRSRRAGLTLIEVVAAIAILGVVLVGIVLAKSRHTRQLAVAQRKQEAVRAADALLTRWWTRPEGVPVDAEGVLEDDPTLRWQTRLVNNKPIDELGARVVRVELHVANPQQSPLEPKDHKLVTVDLVLPVPEEDNQREAASQTQRPQGQGGRRE